jgi:hypothetical protein
MAARPQNATGSLAVRRQVKLALLRMQAHQNIELTDASALKVEEALARFAEASAAFHGAPASLRKIWSVAGSV